MTARRVTSKTAIPIFLNIQNYSPLLALVSRLKVVPNRDTVRCPVHAEIYTIFYIQSKLQLRDPELRDRLPEKMKWPFVS